MQEEKRKQKNKQTKKFTRIMLIMWIVKYVKMRQKLINSNFPRKSLTPILVLFDCKVWSRKKEEGQIYETVLVRFCDLLATFVFILCKSRSKPNLFVCILEIHNIFVLFRSISTRRVIIENIKNFNLLEKELSLCHKLQISNFYFFTTFMVKRHWYFKLRLFGLTEFIVWHMTLDCKDIGIKNQSLRLKVSDFFWVFYFFVKRFEVFYCVFYRI